MGARDSLLREKFGDELWAPIWEHPNKEFPDEVDRFIVADLNLMSNDKDKADKIASHTVTQEFMWKKTKSKYSGELFNFLAEGVQEAYGFTRINDLPVAILSGPLFERCKEDGSTLGYF